MSNALQFVQKKFQEYYIKNKVILPPRFIQREYGFMFFEKEGMVRHLKFSSENEIMEFIRKNVPAHSYYSSAYYKNPEAQKMDEKAWMGADLIFDLDADHMVSGNVSYEEMLNIVKREAKKLIYEFLLNDFGFENRDINLVFSGGRGYHIHIRNNKVLNLGSDERREIVSYITASNMNFETFINDQLLKQRTFLENEGGWYGKFAREIRHVSMLLRELYDSNNISELENILKEAGIRNRKKLLNILFGTKKIFRENNYVVEKRIIDILSDFDDPKRINYLGDEENIQLFFQIVKHFISIDLVGETDEPVTTDIHRLIRLPGSLHGKTGLKVTPVPLENFDLFDPLNDAVVKEFFQKDIKVIIKKDFSIKILDQKFTYKQGEDIMPEGLALFGILRGFVDL
ncbi:MAG: DNA primase catalytic subunit PriS [Thermoplasmata archaeon]|nr:DNA primase catalytic subunit PriS [Thermoplasmata archaeon]